MAGMISGYGMIGDRKIGLAIDRIANSCDEPIREPNLSVAIAKIVILRWPSDLYGRSTVDIKLRDLLTKQSHRSFHDVTKDFNAPLGLFRCN